MRTRSVRPVLPVRGAALLIRLPALAGRINATEIIAVHPERVDPLLADAMPIAEAVPGNRVRLELVIVAAC